MGRPFTVAELDRMPDDGRFGVQAYWVVAPDPGMPELIAFELSNGHYREAAHVRGDEPFAATRPFPLEVVPSRLVAGLKPG